MGEKIYLAQDAHVVKHNVAQNLTDTQKRQARANIGAMSAIGENTSWAEAQAIVNAGLNAEFFPIGTQLIDKWAKNANTEYNVPWDVVHNDTDVMYLESHYCFPEEVVFDEPEAIYCCPAAGLAAGQYYITIGYNYGTNAWVAGHHINFTLTRAMVEGDQLVIDCGKDANNDPTNGRTWKVFAAGGTEVLETGVTSDSDTGTELGSTSSTGVGYTNGQINAPQRVVYGYNRWSQSWYRQWLNSSAAAGSVYVQQNDWDRPPAQASTLRGFMAGLSSDMLAIIKKTTVTTALNTVEGATDATETTQDYFYLPSLTEQYIVPQYTEGVEWDYFKKLAQDNNATGTGGKIPTGTNLDWNKRYRLDATTSSANVRLRSAYRGSAYATWYINSNGYVGSNYAYSAHRGCPACEIRKSA